MRRQENRAWTILLTGPVHGLVGKHGETFPYPPAHYARVNVYAHPPQRKPLTDSALLDMAADFKSQYMHGGITFDEFDVLGFARAIERAHGIGEAL